MNKGSPAWIDLKILNSLDYMWAHKGKWPSVYELSGYFAQQGYLLSHESITERLRHLHAQGIIEAMCAPNGGGPNAPVMLRYSRVRARYQVP